MAHRLSDPWWIPKPLTKEQMEQEIHFSQVKGPAHEEFSPEAVSETLNTLNLTKKYDDPNRYSKN